MENKINIAELLKGCPKGMELDCALYDNVFFDGIDTNDDNFPISLYYKHNNIKNGFSVTKYGTYYNHQNSKCIIFPKGKTTWEGFVPPCNFKDGDILATDLGRVFFLNTRLNTDERYGCYVGKGDDGSFHICEPFAYKECCGLATEKEKEKLFKTIKDNGYKWNPETKTLEELVKPKFKVGDIVKDKSDYKAKIVEVCEDDECYAYESLIMHGIGSISFNGQDSFELVPNKFDIDTLKPFDKVLVRNTNKSRWCGQFYMSYDENEEYLFECTYDCWRQCIPYEGNEHLLGTTDNCDEYYKTW